MTTNVNDEAAIFLSGNSYFRNVATGTMLININNSSILSMDTGSAFYGLTVIARANGTLSSGAGGSYVYGSSLTLMPNTTFMVVVGSGSMPMQFMTCPTSGNPSCSTTKTSNATITKAILDIVSYQSLASLQG